jgi:hypothetical protein
MPWVELEIGATPTRVERIQLVFELGVVDVHRVLDPADDAVHQSDHELRG